VTLTIQNLLTSIKWVSRTSWWNISISRLVILAASVFEMSCGKTDKHTNTAENLTPYPATTVDVDK